MRGQHAKSLLGMTLALIPTAVLAQQVVPRFEVTPFVGYRIGGTFVDSVSEAEIELDGLPAAFGAKLAKPDRPVVALIGDGGLQFTIGELASGVELGLGVPVLVWNNRGYGEIKHYMAERDIPQIGVDIYTPDFQAIARGFGCDAVKAESPAHLKDALRAAVTADRPTVIEIDDDDAQTW